MDRLQLLLGLDGQGEGSCQRPSGSQSLKQLVSGCLWDRGADPASIPPYRSPSAPRPELDRTWVPSFCCSCVLPPFTPHPRSKH